MRQRVLAATLVELAERGYGGLSVEHVASSASVHKTTIYRHWGGLERLVVDALTEHVAEEVPVPDTGSVASDLQGLARGLAKFLQGHAGRSIVAVMLTDATRNPEISAVRDRVFRDRFRRAAEVIARAVERGELPEGTDSNLLLKTLIAPIYFEFLYTGEPPSLEVADRAARVALIAASKEVL